MTDRLDPREALETRGPAGTRHTGSGDREHAGADVDLWGPGLSGYGFNGWEFLPLGAVFNRQQSKDEIHNEG